MVKLLCNKIQKRLHKIKESKILRKLQQPRKLPKKRQRKNPLLMSLKMAQEAARKSAATLATSWLPNIVMNALTVLTT
ncbi:hypothetical protein C3B55_00913 [Candidatus Pseudomonas adelgestsugas]|uniref:Uncharacterized protein n=1 Tax=Candidatus Pseudomonas adelgestsugas TaxID=1302376 RepID=A0ABX5R9Z6_9PSED|nr:hypothetical protein C3B55_00913 [Candidatus Pseudomonas adelgestsugas]